MHRSPACLFAIVPAILTIGCALKPAGSAAGAGGAGGSSISTGDGGAGGSAGTGPIGLPDASIGISMDADLSWDASMQGTSTPDANCGAKSKSAVKLPPEILFVLDRSGSMNEGITPCTDGGTGTGPGPANCGKDSKWAKVIPALTKVIAETENDVSWGLKFFPDNGSGNTCNVSSKPEVAIGLKNAAAITAAVAGATDTNGGVLGYNGTPTRAVITGAVDYLKSLTDTNPKLILLATDGVPTCGMSATGTVSATTNDATAPTAIATARDAGFKTFVVGIGTSAAEATLSAMANAGGLPRNGTPSYYPVSSADDLASAIRTLIGVAATCTFKVGPAPDDIVTDLGKINVFGDDVEINRDETHKDGYDYTDASMQSIEVFGPRCNKIMTGAIKDVTVTFRCIVN
jgi:hypothetical protein